MGPQQMCSEIIRVYEVGGDGALQPAIAILEEISASSAIVQLETPVSEGAVLRLVCSGCSMTCEFQGKVAACQYREGLGYFAQLEFEAGTNWRADLYRPEHLLDPAALVHANEMSSICCDGMACRARLMACVAAVDFCLSDQASSTGREVANLCGGMDEAAAAKCFSHLFRISPKCYLFREFYGAYESERRRIGRGPIAETGVRDRLEKVLALVMAIPEEVFEI